MEKPKICPYFIKGICRYNPCWDRHPKPLFSQSIVLCQLRGYHYGVTVYNYSYTTKDFEIFYENSQYLNKSRYWDLPYSIKNTIEIKKRKFIQLRLRILTTINGFKTFLIKDVTNEIILKMIDLSMINIKLQPEDCFEKYCGGN